MSRASRSPLRRAARVCRAKLTHNTLQDAQQRVIRDLKMNGTRQRPYECEMCGFWHLATIKETCPEYA